MRILTVCICVFTIFSARAGDLLFLDPETCDAVIESPRAFDRLTKNLKYEVAVARAYLTWRDRPEENLLIASDFENWTFPAFDGVVRDRDGHSLANFSIKGIRMAGDYALPANLAADKIFRLARKAATQVSHWGKDRPWEARYGKENLEALLASDRTPPRRIRFLNVARNLFSIPTSASRVRSRIILAITDSDGALVPFELQRKIRLRNQLQKIVNDHAAAVESILLLAHEESWEVFPR